jgi:VCBS repeat protein
MPAKTRTFRLWRNGSKGLTTLVVALGLVVTATPPVAAAAAQPTFTAPITFTGVLNSVGFSSTANGATTTGDLNHDGLDDLITAATTVVNGSLADVVVTQLALGNGQFAPPVQTVIQAEQSGNAVDAVAVGDFNRDGRTDVVVGVMVRFWDLSPSPIVVMLGNGAGGFLGMVPLSQGGLPSGVYSVAVADVTGDGNLDIVSEASDTTYEVSVLPGKGDGSFGAPILSPSGATSPLVTRTLVADVTGDTVPDVVQLLQTGSNDFAGMEVLVETGAGNGTFTGSVRASLDTNPFSAALVDLNGDGHPDLLVSGSGGTNGGTTGLFEFIGGTGGAFASAVRFPYGGGNVAVADYNGDLLPDVATNATDPSGQAVAAIYLNTSGGISPASPMATFAVPGQMALSGRFNGDTAPDLLGYGAYTLLNTTSTAPAAGPGLNSLTLNPTAVLGGTATSGSVSLTAPSATNSGITLTSSRPAVATVPASVVVPAGTTSVNFVITTAAVTSPVVVTITAWFGGSALSQSLTVNPPDLVAILSAQYSHPNKLLSVQATSNRAGAVLGVYVTDSGQFLGTLSLPAPGTTTYSGQFPLQNNPKSITVKSSQGGNATAAVTTK